VAYDNIPEDYARLDRKTRLRVICRRSWGGMNGEPCNGEIATIKEFDAYKHRHLWPFIGFSPKPGDRCEGQMPVRVVRFEPGWREEQGVWGPSKRSEVNIAAGRPPRFATAAINWAGAPDAEITLRRLRPSPQQYPARALCPICHQPRTLDAAILDVVVIPDREQPGQHTGTPQQRKTP
jgi:hypothetical protein